MEWKDKQNDIDDVMAEDINGLAHEVIRLDGDKADSQNENGGFSAGVNSRAGSGAGIGAWSVAYSGCAAGKYAKAEYGGAAGHGAVTSDGFAGGHDAKAADQNGRGIDAVQLGTGTNSEPKTLQVYDYPLMDAEGNIPSERLANAPKTNVVDSLTSSSATDALSAKQGKALKSFVDTKADKQNANGGFSAGNNANAEYTGAAIGQDALCQASGGAVGDFATSDNGGAVGQSATASNGGAVGYNAITGDGFAGGTDAHAMNANSDPIDAIQLGTGTNNTPKTMQVYNKRIVEVDGSLSDVGKLSELNTTAKGTIVAAINELKANGSGIADLGTVDIDLYEDKENAFANIRTPGIYKYNWEHPICGLCSGTLIVSYASETYQTLQLLIDNVSGVLIRDVSMTTNWSKLLDDSNVINNLSSTSTQNPLSANQGKVLKDELDTKPGKSLAGQQVSIDEETVETALEGAEIFNDYRARTYNGSTEAGTVGNVAYGKYSHAEGKGTTAIGDYSHVEGFCTKTGGHYSHSEGYITKSSGANSHAEGNSTEASNDSSHAEGSGTVASGVNSHAEGCDTVASGRNSHAEGSGSIASGSQSHAEGGNGTEAKGLYSHAEGSNTKAISSFSHSEGSNTKTRGNYSHAEGSYTEAVGAAQHVQGRYNLVDEAQSGSALSTYAHIVGNGTSDSARSNAHTIDWNGNGWFAGDVTVGAERKRLATIDEAGGKKHSVFVIGTSTSGHTEKDVDYLCDGTDDQEEINAAIQALPAGGGEIKLLEGTYNVTSDILLNKQSVTLSGSGGATLITAPSPEGVQNITISTNNCMIRNLVTSLEGGIAITGNNNTMLNCTSRDESNLVVSGSYNTVKNCNIGRFSWYQYSFSGSYNRIIGNNIDGIINSSAHNLFEGNIISSDMGICHTFQTDNIINGNYFYNGGFTCKDRNTVTGNYMENEGGICLTGTYNTVSGNTFYYCMGAMVQNVISINEEAKYNNVSGNTIHGDFLSVDGGQYCVYVTGSNNMITSNFLNSDVENTGSNNLLANNLIVAPEG